MKQTTTKTNPKIEHAIRTIPEMVSMSSPYADEGFRLGVLWALEQIRQLIENIDLIDVATFDTSFKLSQQ